MFINILKLLLRYERRNKLKQLQVNPEGNDLKCQGTIDRTHKLQHQSAQSQHLSLMPVCCQCFTDETELVRNIPKRGTELLDEVKHEGSIRSLKLELLKLVLNL